MEVEGCEKLDMDLDESPESLADQVVALEGPAVRDRLVQIFGHLKYVRSRLQRWEEDAEEEFVIDKGNDDSVVEIDDPEIRYDSYKKPLSQNVGEEEVKEEKSARNSCFNCGGSHMISECKEPRDHARIAANRRAFAPGPGGGGGGPQSRYHVDEKQRLGHIRPGLPSTRLRKALGMKGDIDKRLPEFIYRMRDLGYPPAWLRHAEINNSGLSLYMDRGRVLTAEETTNGEDGELQADFEEVKKVQYDSQKLLEWPGFNVEPPKGYQDESRLYRAPSLSSSLDRHSLKHMKDKMGACEQKGYVRGQMPSFTKVEKDDEEEEEEVEEQSPFAAASTSSGAVKSRDEGTPIVTTYSPFTSIPDSSKWTTMTTDHIFFENLPDSTGKYQQFKEVLKKCRKRLAHTAPEEAPEKKKTDPEDAEIVDITEEEEGVQETPASASEM